MVYFLETKAAEQRALLCQWAEFFYGLGKKIQVVVSSTAAAQHLDRMLWTFSQPSFIPHRIVAQSEDAKGEEPVLISVGELYVAKWEVLLCDSVVRLDFMTLYPIAMHFIILDDQDRLQSSRLMWQQARDLRVDLRHVPQNVNNPRFGWPPPAKASAVSH
jgi:DNA polymerase-3 subunit chi